MLFLLKGMVIGFSLAAPVGPIAMICVNRTLIRGTGQGLVTGLGAATADALYATVAAFGLFLLSDFMFEYRDAIRLVGGSLLIFLGARIFLLSPAGEQDDAGIQGSVRHYLMVLFLTLTNPMTIIIFMAAFSALGVVAGGEDYLPAVLLILGVFCGSMIWWIFLSFIVSAIKKKLKPGSGRLINRITGTVLILFGALVFYSRFVGGH